MVYKLVLGFDGVKRDDAFIPNAPGNANWLEYQAFLDGGGLPEPADAPTAEQAAWDAAEAAEKLDIGSLSADIAAELAWLTTAIADIDTGLAVVDAATLAQLRVIVKGLMQNQRRVLLEQRAELKAWRYVIRRL